MADLERRFGGLNRLYGQDGAARIRAAHIAVVGVGGVGSWAAEALVRSGIREITLVDYDQIAESNMNRQIHALHSTLGKAKVHALQERFAEINPDCQVNAVEEFVEAQTENSPANWPDLLPDRPLSAVIDACDQVKAKMLLAAWACQQKIPFISAGAAGGKEQANMVEVDDLANVTHDPLLSQLRYRLRKQHAFPKKGKMKVACVFSREPVAQPHTSCEISAVADGSLNCHGYGSTVAVTATFGFVAAGFVLSKLANG